MPGGRRLNKPLRPLPPIELHAPFAYDATRVLVIAATIEQAGSANPADYLPKRAIIIRAMTGAIAFDAQNSLQHETSPVPGEWTANGSPQTVLGGAKPQ